MHPDLGFERIRSLLSVRPDESLAACRMILLAVPGTPRLRVVDVEALQQTHECEIHLQVGRGSARVRCSPVDLSASLMSGMDAQHLLVTKLVRLVLPHGESGDGSTMATAEAGDNSPSFAISDRAYRAIRALRQGQDVIFIGPSASGKSIAARQVAQVLGETGAVSIWVDLSAHTFGIRDLALEILRAPTSPEELTVIVLDDLQSDPQRAVQFSSLVGHFRSEFGLRLAQIGAGWPSAASLVEELSLERPVVSSCSSSEILTHMFSTDYRQQVEFREEVERLARGDLLVAHAALDFIRSSGRVPSRDEIAGYVVHRQGDVTSLSQDARRLLYWLCCLGTYDVEVERGAAHRFVPGDGKEPLNELMTGRWLRQRGSYLSVGHRSLAVQIVAVLRDRYPNDTLAQSPTQLTVNYLRSVGDVQIRSTLDRLDLSSHGALKPADQHGSGFLARCWTSLGVLVSVMERMCGQDVTWGDNTASATFAARTLSEFSATDYASRIVTQLRRRWDYGDGGSLPMNAGQPTADRVDFDEIAKAMREEESILGSGRDAVDSLDLDQFHRTWALGLLLGLESDPVLGDCELLSVLVSAAESSQSADGSFYPARVPWITARVLLGLTAAGHSIHTSPMVARACAWLRRPEPDGPFDFGTWRSGTGVWNSDAMTTAMCVLALVRAGVETSDITVASGLRFLLASRPAWLALGNEIDGALAVEAAIRTSMNWREYHREITSLLTWARDQEVWSQTGKLASESHTESSKVPFVASSLVEIIWTIVRSELPLILEGLGAEVDEVGVGVEQQSGAPSSGAETDAAVVLRLVKHSSMRAGRKNSSLIGGVSPDEAASFKRFVASSSSIAVEHSAGFEVKEGGTSREIVLTAALLKAIREELET